MKERVKKKYKDILIVLWIRDTKKPDTTGWATRSENMIPSCREGRSVFRRKPEESLVFTIAHPAVLNKETRLRLVRVDRYW